MSTNLNTYMGWENLFNPEEEKKVFSDQQEYILEFKKISGRLLELQGQHEAHALPELAYVNTMMEKLNKMSRISDFFERFDQLKNPIIWDLLTDLSNLIIKVGLFPNTSVLSETAKFLEYMIIFSLKLIKEGDFWMINRCENILASTKKAFYTSNTTHGKIQPNYFPFGFDLGEASCKKFVEWCKNSLNVGDHIDAVKTHNDGIRAIWSRATVTQIGDLVEVEYHGEPSNEYHRATLEKLPFSINMLGTK